MQIVQPVQTQIKVEMQPTWQMQQHSQTRRRKKLVIVGVWNLICPRKIARKLVILFSYGDWTKGDKCKTCYDKCVKSGKAEADCKAGCCSDKTKPVDVDAGSNPKEDDVAAPDAVDAPGDVTPQG
jgi:hypothetical protein